MKEIIKLIIKYIVWIVLHVFYLLPINEKKIYFRAFHGKQFGCNPKYLFLYIQEHCAGRFICIWEMPGTDAVIPGATCVKRLSVASFIQMMTSRYIVTNNDFMWWIPLRKRQVMLETWHGGGAYKRVGLYEQWSRIMLLDQKLNARRITHYISSSRKFTEVQAPSKWVPEEKFIHTGLPRNELFFYPEWMKKCKEKVFAQFDLKSDIHLLLYAPTYRGLTGYKSQGTECRQALDYTQLLAVLEKKFGGQWVLLFRGHYFDSGLAEKLPGTVVDATRYEDMQELLCAADVLVTDYSSSMWDFALTKKPCFLYAPDLQQYVADRGFYTDPSTWPFPMAQNDEELARNILDFDAAAYGKAVDRHLADFGSYENKDACRKVLAAIGMAADA